MNHIPTFVHTDRFDVGLGREAMMEMWVLMGMWVLEMHMSVRVYVAGN